jgi:16S rRNA C1402 N4-methylase RsmH
VTHTKGIGSIGHVLSINQLLLSNSLVAGDTVVDATLGNGHDAQMLLNIIGPKGFLYGFDIQSSAIQSSQRLLDEQTSGNFKLIQDSHENLTSHISEPIKGFVFNLGYLPKGDKTITTEWKTTETALLQAMELLLPNGFISVTTYPGHENGREEDQSIETFFSSLDQKQFQIAQSQFINQQNNPPKLYWLTKRVKK